MRRRILTAIIGVVVLSTLALTVPLAIVLANRKQADAVTELERAAERTAAVLEPDVGTSGAAITIPKEEGALTVAVYDVHGRRLAGEGPDVADSITRTQGISTKDGTIGDQRVLARPVIIDGKRVATIRVAEATSEASERARNDVLLLLGFDLAALTVAVVVGAMLSGRLARPLRAVRDDAVRLGEGDFTIGERTSGVDEIDETSQALAHTASRLDAVLQRERTFSANASHQLRTPVTSMRLAIESELVNPREDHAEVLQEVLADLDRLETTIATLLSVARDLPRDYAPTTMQAVAHRIEARWHQACADRSRALAVHPAEGPPIRVAVPVLDEIIDVLVDNALRHGRGPIDVEISDDTDLLVVTVTDQGRLASDPAAIFKRRAVGTERHGLGLALARSLAEAEGGRLVLVAREPATFQLLLPDRV